LQFRGFLSKVEATDEAITKLVEEVLEKEYQQYLFDVTLY